MPSSTPKRRKIDVANNSDLGFAEINATDYEEDLDSILALIKQQEESEALAQQLQSEWNDLPNTSANASNSSRATIIDVDEDIVILDDDASEAEDDAAMARRLAREWEREDNQNNLIDAGLSSKTTTGTPPRPFKLVDMNLETPPDARLLEHRELFVRNRNCPKCNKQIKSPRGLVSLADVWQSPRRIHFAI